MMGTIIRVLSDVSGHNFVSLEQTTRGVVNPAIVPLELDDRAEPFVTFFSPGATAKAVQAVGAALYAALSSNPNIQSVFNALLMITPPEIEPIYIYLDSAAGDEFPWESLCAAGNTQPGFLALDPRWPIGRIVGRASGPTIERPFVPPLRILAVLAASDVGARSEWKSLYGAIQHAGLDIKVLVLLCEKDLKDEIEALRDARITTEYVIDAIGFRQAVGGFRPNFLHFFCHGLGGSAPKLQLATRADFDGRAPVGSVEIEPRDLIWASGLRDALWLVMLNCCQGAETIGPATAAPAAAAPNAAGPPPGIHPFARSLVEQGSFPAVVGMRERIAVNAANTFTQSFYLSVFEELTAAMELNGTSTSIEWVRMLSKPRSDLRPVDSKHWTFPVLYVRPEEFQLEQTIPGKEDVQAELKVLRSIRDEVGDQLPPDKLVKFNERIRQLEAELAA
jgi:CHAT domain